MYRELGNLYISVKTCTINWIIYTLRGCRMSKKLYILCILLCVGCYTHAARHIYIINPSHMNKKCKDVYTLDDFKNLKCCVDGVVKNCEDFFQYMENED